VNVLESIFIFLTIIMWIDLVISSISISFNQMMIEELENKNILIKKRNEKIKSFLSKIFKN
jgi:hypothetical protein